MAATAYAAVISLMHLTEEVQLYNAGRPIFIDVELRQIESLQERVHFLKDFLEGYHYKSSEEIADVVYTITEDIMKSQILNDIHVRRQVVKQFQNKKNENTRILHSRQGRSRPLLDFLKGCFCGKNIEVKGLERGNNNEVYGLESQIAEVNIEVKGLERGNNNDVYGLESQISEVNIEVKGLERGNNNEVYGLESEIAEVNIEVKGLERGNNNDVYGLESQISEVNVEVKGLERGNNNEVYGLESQVAEVVYAAEDIIETHVVDHLRLINTINHGNKSSIVLSQDLQDVIKIMDFINKKVMKIKEENGFDDHESRYLATMHSLGPPLTGKDIIMGFDDQILDMLTGRQSSLQIIPIYGMGGIGKTTLAKSAYDHRSIMEHFYVRSWITVSQEYNIRDMLLCLLQEIGGPTGDKNEEERSAYHHLGENLYKHLSGRRYLIIMDDIWNIEAWDKLKMFFPDNNNGSRIMVTTRLSHVANSIGHSNLYEMNLLDENASWNLLCKTIFAQDGCPSEMEEVGRKIAKNCKGLPLSIVVIGGLLAKSKMTIEYWEYVAENISSTVNSENNDRCLKILSLSYSHLPIHLKPCFLYIGVYPEDHEIRVTKLIHLWVAEGFLKPHETKHLEEVAEDYLKDLIDRNLVFVSMFGSTGNMKYCKIHDLLRDFCLRQAQKEKFIHVTKVHSPDTPRDMNSQPRITNDIRMPHDENYQNSNSFTNPLITCSDGEFESPNFRLLKVLDIVTSYSCGFFILLNLRHLNFRYQVYPFPEHMFWNLKILICSIKSIRIPILYKNPFPIWKMLQLRHLIVDSIFLADPPDCQVDEIDDFVLKNLKTLSRVRDFRCTEDVLKRIPNIKKLNLVYSLSSHTREFSEYGLNNLSRLHKLQSLELNLSRYSFGPTRINYSYESLEFPHSLKKLSLQYFRLDWEDVATKIGSKLPNLEKLKLECLIRGEEWNPVVGQFLRLKFLQIIGCSGLVYWTADSSHFPCLERLSLVDMTRLKEIPSGIGDIATLKLIQLHRCNYTVVASAKEILEEQRSLGNEDIHLRFI